MQAGSGNHIVLYSIPLFLGMIVLELAYAHWRRLDVYERRDALASLGMGVGNVLITIVMEGAWVGLFVLAYQYRLIDLPVSAWWVWLLALVAQDFCFYWYHRSSHRVRVFWAAHVNHHSSERFNLTTALRQSWTTPVYSFMFFLPLAMIGVHPALIVAVKSVSLVYQFFIHTEVVGRLGPLEWVFNTPSHHRVHHGSNDQYIDRNYGGILIVWDRLFGTFEPEGVKVKFGLTKNINSYNLFVIAFHQWLAIAGEIRRSPRDVLRCLFMPPEWQPGQPETPAPEDGAAVTQGA